MILQRVVSAHVATSTIENMEHTTLIRFGLPVSLQRLQVFSLTILLLLLLSPKADVSFTV